MVRVVKKCQGQVKILASLKLNGRVTSRFTVIPLQIQAVFSSFNLRCLSETIGFKQIKQHFDFLSSFAAECFALTVKFLE